MSGITYKKMSPFTNPYTMELKKELEALLHKVLNEAKAELTDEVKAKLVAELMEGNEAIMQSEHMWARRRHMPEILFGLMLSGDREKYPAAMRMTQGNAEMIAALGAIVEAPPAAICNDMIELACTVLVCNGKGSSVDQLLGMSSTDKGFIKLRSAAVGLWEAGDQKLSKV